MSEHRLTVHVPASSRDYPIITGDGLLGDAAELLQLGTYSKIFVVTDTNVEKLWLPALAAALPKGWGLHAVKAGEEHKNLGAIQAIWQTMHDAGCDRKSLVLALGGGVVGDMAGFAASTYMRGIAFAHLPTTLLAQVDSSIGGKTGVDFAGLKNFVGTFAQPVAVVADTATLATLPLRELRAGYAEMLKHGLIHDEVYWNKLIKQDITTCLPEHRAELVATSNRIKAAVVESDETEAGLRKILNFGHTIGHAVESLSWQTSRPLLHGEAVAIGMVAEAELSHRAGYLARTDVTRIREGIAAAQLPVAIPYLPLADILAKLRGDKKNEHGKVQFTLLESIGTAVFNQTVSEELLTAALKNNMESK